MYYFYSSSINQILRHTFGYNFKEKVRMLHEFVAQQKVFGVCVDKCI